MADIGSVGRGHPRSGVVAEMTSPASARLNFVAAIRKIEEACPCAKVTPWAGCAGRDWSDDREMRGREAECKCISTATEAIDCYWPGHAAAREAVDVYAYVTAPSQDADCLIQYSAVLRRECGIEP